MVAAIACIHSVLSHIPFHTTTSMYSWLLRLHAFILYYHTYHSTLQQACIHGCCGCMHSFCTITHTIPHYNKHVFMVAATACIHSINCTITHMDSCIWVRQKAHKTHVPHYYHIKHELTTGTMSQIKIVSDTAINDCISQSIFIHRSLPH